jgi:hypothetical protein
MEHIAAGPLGSVEATAFARAMREWLWLYPLVEVVHIVGIALLVGAVLIFDLRILGLNRRIPVEHLARHLLPVALGALVLVVPSGLAMFSAHASEFIVQRTFLIKMLLLFAAGHNAVFFHLAPYRGVAGWSTGAPAPLAAKASALVSIAIWIGVITCGRLLAYT